MGELDERLGADLSDDFLRRDFQPLKEPLIQQPPFLRPGQAVRPLYISGQFKRSVKGSQYLVVCNGQMVDALFSSNALPPDALLLGSKQALAHLIGVVGGQQLVLLLLQAGKLQLCLGHLFGRQHRGSFDVATHRRPDALTLFVAQLQLGVVLLDGGLDSRHAVGRVGARSVLPTTADEVLVFPAVAFGFGENQATAALGAKDAATQVVEVPPGTFATDPLGLQQVLHLLKRRLVNQRLVPALVQLAVVLDLTDVVRIAEDETQIVGLERSTSHTLS